MKVQNKLSKPTGNSNNDKGSQAFNLAITGNDLQNLIRKSVPDAASAARLTGALIASVAASPQLQNCKASSIVSAALRGEGQGLTIGREYHLVPFGDMCAYVVSYKGLIALALATGDVSDMDCIAVREGEYVGRDPRTKRPKFDFSIYATDEEAEQHEIIGYYAYIEKMDGFFRAEYMSIGEILSHAERYSKTFSRAKYDAVFNGLGDYTPQEIEKIKASSPWYSSAETMMKKTVIRKLLNSGYVRLANSAALKEALAYDNASDDGVIPDLDLGIGVDNSTGEVIESTATVSDADVSPTSAASVAANETARAKNRGENGAKNAATSDEDFTRGFFGGEDE